MAKIMVGVFEGGNFMFDKDFFWNLFLNTGRIDAYLLLKNENEEDGTKQ